MASTKVSPGHDARQVAALLALPEIIQFITDLDALRWTGRPGNASRVMVGATLVKAVYALPTWTRTARLIAEHAALREAIGGAPSQWACYRFATKLREHGDALADCIDRILAKLRDAKPDMGKTVAIDGSDLPAYANGQRFVKRGGELRKRFADPDASWGHRSSISTRSGGGYYGYKVHAAVRTTTGLPVAWQVETAKDPELPLVPTLLDTVTRRGFRPDVCVLDRGYDAEVVYEGVESRHMRPVIPLRETPAVKAGKAAPPKCDHGEWTFAGSDAKRGASKWRCPTGECTPASVWVKASRLHPLIPRNTDRFKALYHQRGAVEREFGVLKHEWGMLPLRVRRLERVRLHVDLTILAELSGALARTAAGRMAA
ncbi:MAG TPA: transposase [Streptosporangiaceae bacterium]|nr:transposase [Streptosporangiaceae bacterium]